MKQRRSGARLPSHLAGRRHVLAQQCERKAWPQSEVQQGFDSILPDHQGPVQSRVAEGNGHGTKLRMLTDLD